jgi:MurNAc alpha-1-phosphate uridylyltransferase
MLDRALDALAAAGVTDVVVNTFYLGHMISDHLAARAAPKIKIVNEHQLLDTGGGVKNALAHFGDDPFFVLNGDVLWTDGPSKPALARLRDAWDGDKMDILLLLHPFKDLPAHAGSGDYFLPDGSMQPRFARHKNAPLTPNMVFAGPRIVHPRLFNAAPDGAFSFLDLFHKAEAAGRLYAVVHDGAWYHVGTPDALRETDAILMRP